MSKTFLFHAAAKSTHNTKLNVKKRRRN